MLWQHQCTEAWATEDRAVLLPDGSITIANSETRVASEVLDFLSTWQNQDWFRRTGHVRCSGDELISQLRIGVDPARERELSFHEFAAAYEMCWSEKPNWRCARVFEARPDALGGGRDGLRVHANS